VLALCDGNRAEIVDAWRSKDTMHSVGKFITLFRKLDLQSCQVGGDEGYGHQLMDRMQEQNFYLQRFNNGSPAKRSDIYANLSAEWWSTVGQLIERRHGWISPAAIAANIEDGGTPRKPLPARCQPRCVSDLKRTF
jgi:hypothetical protein